MLLRPFFSSYVSLLLGLRFGIWGVFEGFKEGEREKRYLNRSELFQFRRGEMGVAFFFREV